MIQRSHYLNVKRDGSLVERDEIPCRPAEVRNKYDYARKEFKTQDRDQKFERTDLRFKIK